MARFTIYSPAGVALYEGTPSFTGQYMKPGLLEFREVALPALVDLVPGCYVDYTRTGHRYRIYTAPQLKKQARSLTYGGAFVYQSVQLYDASKMLEYCPFRDLVLGDNRIYFSTQPSISTFEGCDGLARRFEACLVDQYGANSWAVRIATQAENSDLHDLMLEPRDFTVSGVNILECLEKIYEIWPGVGWLYTVENSVDTIVIGGVGTNSGTYAYGKGNGLTSLTRTAANAEEIANRIFAYGSSRNMLPRWYNSQNIKDAESVDIQNLMIPVSSWGLTDNLPDAANAFVEDAASILKNGLRPATVYFDGKGEYPEIYPSIRETTIGMVRTAIGDSTAKYYPSTAVYTNPNERIDEVLAAPATYDSGKAGADGKDAVKTDSESVTDTESGSVPAQIPAFQKLYLNPFYTKTVVVDGAGDYTIKLNVPATGTASLTGALGYLGIVIRAYRINSNSTETLIGEQETKMSQSTSDATAWTFKAAYLSVPQDSFSAGQSVRFEARVVMAKTVQNGAGAYTISLSGNASYSIAFYRAKTFTISIRQVGFDINEQAALGNGKTIAMRTGKCAGRSFAINDVQYDEATDSWKLECWRTEDESLSQWFPNTDYPVEADDEFVLLDIAMPSIYVQMAEQKLLTAAQELLADTAVERWQYSPEIDAKFMVENNRTINAGEYLLLSDADIIGVSAESVLVDTVTINEGESAIPTYKVTLRDRKKKTWTESQSPEQSSGKSVGNIQTQQDTPYVDLSGYVKQDEFNNLAGRVTALEGESFFMLDTDGNVTLKPQYQNLWVPGWFASGGVGSGGGSGIATELGDLVDVALTTPDNGDLLVYNLATSHWENKPQSSIIPSVSIGFDDLTSHPTTIAGYGITDANIANGTITLGGNTITPLTAKPSYSLDEISGTDDLRAIEALAGTAGLLKKTAENTWALDTTQYLSSHQSVTLASGTNNGTLKLTTAAGTVDNIAVKGLQALAYKASLSATDIPDLYALGTKVTDAPGLGILLGVSVMSANLATSAGGDTSRVQWDHINDAWHFYGNVYVDGFLASGGIGSGGGGGYGVEEITSNEDGTVDFHFTGGDVTTVDLNHEHPQYASKMAETSQPSGGFLPDVVYELGTLTGSVTFALASAVSGQVNHYFWTFTAGSTAPTITWPSGITWAGSAPTITASKKYQISILDGIAAYMEA